MTPVTGSAEVILIIDDEPGARELMKLVLGTHAYQVLTAENGAEGLNMFRRYSKQISAIIVDRKMPLMDGPEAVRAFREIRRDVAILATTGQASDAAGAGFEAAGIDAFLPKPYTAEQLLASVHELLHVKRPSAHLPADEDAAQVLLDSKVD